MGEARDALLVELEHYGFPAKPMVAAVLREHALELADKIREAVDEQGIFGTDAADLIDPEVE